MKRPKRAGFEPRPVWALILFKDMPGRVTFKTREAAIQDSSRCGLPRKNVVRAAIVPWPYRPAKPKPRRGKKR